MMKGNVKVRCAPVYEVDPLSIKEELFTNPRQSCIEETWRCCILNALEEVKQKSAQYVKPFKIMRVLRVEHMTADELSEFCEKEYGGKFANWNEKALEKAQRITNGETWQEACEHPDTAGWDSIIVP